ncbi:MAG: hypothetical protein FJX77_16295 [Armatimonadetes bacterium]|nr:hypothetical protein [Armatimonadota bacterium]
MTPTDLFPELDTPALLVDLDMLEANLDRMAAALSGTACGIRPHFKSHRISEITRRQQARGALGVTCAKLGEAEHLASLGFDRLLVANEVVGPHKWRRLAELARHRQVLVGMDDLEVAEATSQAAAAAGAKVGFLLDLNAGLNRCGLAPGDAAVERAQRMAELPGLQFRGIMSYEGHAVMLDRAAKEAECRRAMGAVAETATACRDAGLAVEIVSAGGTGTWDVTSRCPGVTEIQAGTYALMDLLFLRTASLRTAARRRSIPPLAIPGRSAGRTTWRSRGSTPNTGYSRRKGRRAISAWETESSSFPAMSKARPISMREPGRFGAEKCRRSGGWTGGTAASSRHFGKEESPGRRRAAPGLLLFPQTASGGTPTPGDPRSGRWRNPPPQ